MKQANKMFASIIWGGGMGMNKVELPPAVRQRIETPALHIHCALIHMGIQVLYLCAQVFTNTLLIYLLTTLFSFSDSSDRGHERKDGGGS